MRFKIYLNRHIGCIETWLKEAYREVANLEPTHRMYWNSRLWLYNGDERLLEPTHRMYWNHPTTKQVMGGEWHLNRHIGCIETLPKLVVWVYIKLEPTHRMYWNQNKKGMDEAQLTLEPTHRMYWNLLDNPFSLFQLSLNRHIGCIETIQTPYF